MLTYAYKGKEGVVGGGRGELVIRYVRTKWMASKKCSGILLYIGLAKYKMSLFSFIIITIILSYAIIRIYKILYIYFQVSETEWLAELH